MTCAASQSISLEDVQVTGKARRTVTGKRAYGVLFFSGNNDTLTTFAGFR